MAIRENQLVDLLKTSTRFSLSELLCVNVTLCSVWPLPDFLLAYAQTHTMADDVCMLSILHHMYRNLHILPSPSYMSLPHTVVTNLVARYHNVCLSCNIKISFTGTKRSSPDLFQHDNASNHFKPPEHFAEKLEHWLHPWPPHPTSAWPH